MKLYLFCEGTEYPNSGTFVPENFRDSEAEIKVPHYTLLEKEKKLLEPHQTFLL